MIDSDDEQQLKQERLKFFVRLTERCVDILSELDNNELRSRYARSDGVLDSYVFTYLSDRTLFLEVVAKFEPSELDNVGSHRFVSHPVFEKIIEKYTKTSKKPNLVLEKSRPWDVAVNLVMKVEAVEPSFCCSYRRLLKREHVILEHIWHSYLRDNMDFDDMTGIPMIFDYKEVPSQGFILPPGELIEEIDLYGRLMQRKLAYNVPTLSYMTMEKLGPNLSYVVDLMGIAKRQPVGLNISTAFKIFDQLICRLLQIHRFGVVHNGICPQNIYFGRSMCYNVVYLNNFRAATLASSQAGSKPCINMRVSKDVRFASLNMMKSTDMHPVDDIESAFYTLLACIGPSLPWDALLHSSKSADTLSPSDDSSGSAAQSPQSRASKNTGQAVTVSRQFYASIRASKSAFWDSNIHLERFIANMMHRLTERESELFQVIAGILQDLYAKIKRLITTYSNSKNSNEFCAQLCRGGGALQMYTELRKPVLMYFTFEQVPPFLNNLTFQNRQMSLAKNVSHLLVGWNLSEWCFNSVEVRPPLPYGRLYSEQKSGILKIV